MAVQLRLTNQGNAAYQDRPDFNVRLVDALGQQYSTTFEDTTAGTGFEGGVAIAAGDEPDGVRDVQRRRGQDLAKLQFALDNGVAEDVGEWSLD